MSEDLDLAGGYARMLKKGRSAEPSASSGTSHVSKRSPRQPSNFKTGEGARKPGYATFTIAGIAHSKMSVGNMLDYISRDDEIELTDSSGLPLVDAEDREDLVEEWDSSFPTRSNGRFAMHFVVSSPEGSIPKDVKAAAEEWAKVNLSDYDYAGCLHVDTDNPHYHLIVARRPDSPRLDFNKKKLVELRKSWADIGTQHGVDMVAPSWFERDEASVSVRNGEHHARKRLGYSQRDLDAATAILSEPSGQADPVSHPDLDRADVEGRSYRWDMSMVAMRLEGFSSASLEGFAKQKRVLDRQAMTLRKMETRDGILRRLRDEAAGNVEGEPMSPKSLAAAYGKHPDYQLRVQGLSEPGTLPVHIKRPPKALVPTEEVSLEDVEKAIRRIKNPALKAEALKRFSKHAEREAAKKNDKTAKAQSKSQGKSLETKRTKPRDRDRDWDFER